MDRARVVAAAAGVAVIAALEVGALLVLGAHWALGDQPFGQRLRQSLAIAAGAWLGEEISLRWEVAYQYAPGWHCWIDRLPLAVLLIWPSVVLSARQLAAILDGRPWPRALWCGAITWLDASLMEPIATHAGLWSWNLPGPFAVAWVGPFGWGAYALSASFLIDCAPLLVLPILAPLVAQGLILLAHWTLGRRLPTPSPDLGLAAAALPALVAIAFTLRLRRRVRLPWGETVARGAAASLFLGLLATAFDGRLALLAAAVSLPYLWLLPRWAGVAKAPLSRPG